MKFNYLGIYVNIESAIVHNIPSSIKSSLSWWWRFPTKFPHFQECYSNEAALFESSLLLGWSI